MHLLRSGCIGWQVGATLTVIRPIAPGEGLTLAGDAESDEEYDEEYDEGGLDEPDDGGEAERTHKRARH